MSDFETDYPLTSEKLKEREPKFFIEPFSMDRMLEVINLVREGLGLCSVSWSSFVWDGFAETEGALENKVNGSVREVN